MVGVLLIVLEVREARALARRVLPETTPVSAELGVGWNVAEPTKPDPKRRSPSGINWLAASLRSAIEDAAQANEKETRRRLAEQKEALRREWGQQDLALRTYIHHLLTGSLHFKVAGVICVLLGVALTTVGSVLSV